MSKIAICLNDYSQLGGVEKVTSNLMKLFIDNNIPLHSVISFSKANQESKVSYPSSVPIYILDIDKASQFVYENEISYVVIQVQNLKQSYDFAKKINAKNVKIIFVLHSTPFAYTKYFLKVDSFSRFKGFVKTNIFTKYKSLFLFKRMIEMSHKFLMVGQVAEQEIKSLLPNEYHEKIGYIYNPTSYQYRIVESDKENIIIYAGRLAVEKRVLHTIKVLRDVLNKYPTWQYLILGEGVEKDEIQEYIECNKLGNVKLLGRVENVDDFLKKSKICILYSLFEGMPTSLLEASFCDNVLISSNSKGGAKDIIEHNVNGYIVDSDKDLAEKVEFLMNDDITLQQMMQSNKSVNAKFNNNIIINEWRRALEIEND